MRHLPNALPSGGFVTATARKPSTVVSAGITFTKDLQSHENTG